MSECDHKIVVKRAGIDPKYVYWACEYCGRTFDPAPNISEMLQAREEFYALKARISELEALIADAPHEQGCAALSWDLYKRGQCTCWKSRALDTKE